MPNMIPAWVDGVLTPVEKLEAHLLGLRHKAVSVFVMDGVKVLIQKRAKGKYHTPGLWANTCCTHPKWNESAGDCAVRRLQEELGITGVSLDHRGAVEYRSDVGGGMTEHELVDVFLAERTPEMRVELNPVEVEEVAWVELDDLSVQTTRTPEKFTPWLRIYLAQHRDKIFAGTSKCASSTVQQNVEGSR